MIKNILLAEDDRGTAYLMKLQLERCGYKVTHVNNGIKALDLIKKHPFDLLITDVVMPEMDGVDLYLALKKDPSIANLPIIIITDKQMFKESFSALGVNHFVSKTSDISLLLSKIQEMAASLPDSRNYHKILIGGTQSVIIKQIQDLFEGSDCLVSTAENTTDLSAKAFLMCPHLILLDVTMKDVATPSELVRSFRAFHFLKNTQIFTYAHLSPDEIGRGQTILDPLKDEILACQHAGTSRHLGRFNRIVFLEAFEEMGIKVNSENL